MKGPWATVLGIVPDAWKQGRYNVIECGNLPQVPAVISVKRLKSSNVKF